MTELASIARRTVSGVLALGDGAVVTTETGADDRRVIDACRTPAPGAMTVLAGRGG
jgi:hypothetical protein